MTKLVPVTIARGDGIGPEIMESVLEILSASKANLEFREIQIGESVYKGGFSSGISTDSFVEISKSNVLLKAPITTPQGGGYKSLNVTLRKKLGLFANVRPVFSLHPFVKTNFPKMDLVIVRENEEDLYAGVEYRYGQVAQSLKIITRDGCERIVRYAFEYAVRNGRKKVTCMTKDNIMKIADGMFHDVFKEVAQEYKQIEADHYIIDIGAARIAAKPEIFDVIVTLNLYGDIISDIASEVSGSVGLSGSSNIGMESAMFEAIHGSAPDIAGKDIANPSGLLNAAVMMLIHLGMNDKAALISNALYKTIEDGIHTADIFNQNSTKKVGTKEFTKEVIARLGQTPKTLPVSDVSSKSSEASGAIKIALKNKKTYKNQLVGADVYLAWPGSIDELSDKLLAMKSEKFEPRMFSCRGVVMWPCLDKSMVPAYYPGQGTIRVRMVRKDVFGKRDTHDVINDSITTTKEDLIQLLADFNSNQLDFIKFEGLYLVNGKPGYTLGQGE